MTTEPYCAICKRKIDPAKSHFLVEAEEKGEPFDGRREIDDWMVHRDCWMSISDGWMPPA
jgi:hypothetical protein